VEDESVEVEEEGADRHGEPGYARGDPRRRWRWNR